MPNPGVLFLVENNGAKDIAFWLEPFARRYVVPVGEQYEIVLEGRLGEPLTVGTTEEGEIQIWCAGNVSVMHRGSPATPKWIDE